MVSAINTKKNKPVTQSPARDSRPHDATPARRLTRRKAGSLTLRILLVNMLPLIVLVVGLLSLGRYQQNLIDEHLKTLEERARNFAVAIEGPDDHTTLIPEQSRRILFKLAENKPEMRIMLFAPDGTMIGDSRQLIGFGNAVHIAPLPPPDYDMTLSASMAYIGMRILQFLPAATTLQPLPDIPPPHTGINGMTYPDIQRAAQGQLSASAWSGAKNDSIILTAGAPVYKGSTLAGTILITNDGTDITAAMNRVRMDVLTATLAALSMTIFMSIYLAGIIGQPLKRLARAAERIRTSKDKDANIPDMSRRGDEIGELSMALRDMTQALRDRMESIESFAADVAHELKNPLTSLRSAVETVAIITDESDRKKLMDIILQDVQRLDRLITDISKASRLDAELSRDEMTEIDLRNLLENIVSNHKTPMERTKTQPDNTSTIKLDIPRNHVLKTLGNEGRLAQVFENLIGNALSFSPENGIVTIRAIPAKDRIIIEVEDEGTGIPENNLDDIFGRFYSQRPKTESYGKHSGLGLSIAKQIITAHNGDIYAENIKKDGQIMGACFTVILNSV